MGRSSRGSSWGSTYQLLVFLLLPCRCSVSASSSLSLFAHNIATHLAAWCFRSRYDSPNYRPGYQSQVSEPGSRESEGGWGEERFHSLDSRHRHRPPASESDSEWADDRDGWSDRWADGAVILSQSNIADGTFPPAGSSTAPGAHIPGQAHPGTGRASGRRWRRETSSQYRHTHNPPTGDSLLILSLLNSSYTFIEGNIVCFLGKAC